MRKPVMPATIGVACLFALASPETVQADQQQPGAAPRATTTPSKSASKIDPKADKLLKAMSTALTSATYLQFDASHVQEVVTKDGEKLQFLAESHVQLARPNKLRSDRIGPIADVTLYYDGSNVTIYGKRANLYATAKAPATLDAAIEFGRDDLGLEAPAADLLYSDVYAGLMEDVVSGTYLGEEPIGDRLCHHLAFRSDTTDWQIWIDEGAKPLPCRYVITSKDVDGSPQYSVALTDWKLAPIPASRFEFVAPAGATKIDFWGSEHAKKQVSQRAPTTESKQPPQAN